MKNRFTIFCGPSIDSQSALALLPNSDIRPPVARGDLYRAREEGAENILIIDGVFGQNLAVSPREVVDVARDGALIVGAASMGALRAAECHPAGVIGVGLIYRLFRLGLLESDDEVAVITAAENHHQTMSLALINVRYAVSKAMRRGMISKELNFEIIEAAKSLYFAERTWNRILAKVSPKSISPELLQFFQSLNLKRQDAGHSIQFARNHLQSSSPTHIFPNKKYSLKRVERCPGHHKTFGFKEEFLKEQLVQWLFGSGRYQKYIWSLAAGDVKTESIPHHSDGRAFALREQLPGIIKYLIDNPQELQERIWNELSFLDEIDAELMRYYAVCTLSQMPEIPNEEKPPFRRVQEEFAIAHGVTSWQMLCDEVVDGNLFGAIPMNWIENAVQLMARARVHSDHLAQKL